MTQNPDWQTNRRVVGKLQQFGGAITFDLLKVGGVIRDSSMFKWQKLGGAFAS